MHYYQVLWSFSSLPSYLSCFVSHHHQQHPDNYHHQQISNKEESQGMEKQTTIRFQVENCSASAKYPSTHYIILPPLLLFHPRHHITSSSSNSLSRLAQLVHWNLVRQFSSILYFFGVSNSCSFLSVSILKKRALITSFKRHLVPQRKNAESERRDVRSEWSEM